MIQFGKQKGKVLGVYTGINETSKNVYVNIKFALPSGDAVYSKVYITEKSAALARIRLKMCGIDLDACELADIEAFPNAFDGNEVDLDIYEEDYKGKPQMRVDIVTERPKAEVSALKAATALLRAAKKSDELQPGEGRKVIQGFPKQPRRPASAAPPADEGSQAGEDIPF